jgi:hypothetical protein
MTTVIFTDSEPPPMTPESEARLKALAEMPDSQIDFSDIPKITDFSGFMTVDEVKAYRAEKKKQTVSV